MALTLHIGKVDKRPNSTKRNFSWSYLIEDAFLKDNVDIKSPIFKLKINDETDLFRCNYLEWDNRYYYISNVVCVANDLYEVHCSMDLLATYRDQIIGSKAALSYTTNSAYTDLWKDDLRFTPTMIRNDRIGYTSRMQDNTPRYSVWNLDLDSPWDFTNGTYLMSCVGNGDIAGNSAGKHVWILTARTLNTALSNIFDNWDIIHPTSKQLEAIKAITWIPISRDYIVNHGDVGTADLEIGGETLAPGQKYFRSIYNTYEGNVFLTIPSANNLENDPESPNWMENGRWKTLELQLPGGVVDVDPDLFYGVGDDRLHIRYTINLNTGEAMFKVYPYHATVGAGNISQAMTDSKANKLIGQTSICYGLDMMDKIERARILGDDIRNIIFTAASAAAGIGAVALSGGTAAVVAGASAAASSAGATAATAGANAAKVAAVSRAKEGAAILGKATTTTTSSVDSISYSPSIRSFSANTSGSSIYALAQESRYILLSAKYYINDTLCETHSKTPLEKWNDFCNECGYPAVSGMCDLGLGYYVCRYASIKTGNSAMTAEESIAIEEVCKHGIWIE